jgi:hypothetical protein
MKAETILNSKPSINGQMNDLLFEYADIIEAMKEYAKEQIKKDRDKLTNELTLCDWQVKVVNETHIILD